MALGNRIMEELANSCTNDEELINNSLKLCTPISLAEHAYLAGEDNSDDNILTRIGRKNFHTTTSNYMVNAASYGIVYALCGDVQGAAARWRSIINDAETNGDEARYAHTAIAATLFAYRDTITTSDLSALIDMFNEREQARESGKETLTLSFCDPMRHYGSVNSVERLIDYVAQRMSGAERPQ